MYSCTVLTINIFTDFGALFPIFPVQHLHFSFKSFEVVSLVSASSGVFHLIHNEVETFCIRHLNAGEKKNINRKNVELEENSCTDNNFQTHSRVECGNLFSHFKFVVPIVST